MFNGVLYVREVCQAKGIPISQLEKDCGFANGYLNPKKLKKIPMDRAIIIANYLGIEVSDLLPEIKTEKAPTESGERQVSDEDIKFALFGGDGEITDAMYDEVRRFAAFVKQREADKKE